MGLLEHITTVLPSKQYGNTFLYFDTKVRRVMLIGERDEESNTFERFSYVIEDQDKKPRYKLVTELANCARVECPTSLEDTWIIPVLSQIPNVERLLYANENVSEAASMMMRSIYMVFDYENSNDSLYPVGNLSEKVIEIIVGNSAGEQFKLPFLVFKDANRSDGKPVGHIFGEAYQFCPLGIRTKKGTLFAELR